MVVDKLIYTIEDLSSFSALTRRHYVDSKVLEDASNVGDSQVQPVNKRCQRIWVVKDLSEGSAFSLQLSYNSLYNFFVGSWQLIKIFLEKNKR